MGKIKINNNKRISFRFVVRCKPASIIIISRWTQRDKPLAVSKILNLAATAHIERIFLGHDRTAVIENMCSMICILLYSLPTQVKPLSDLYAVMHILHFIKTHSSEHVPWTWTCQFPDLK